MIMQLHKTKKPKEIEQNYHRRKLPVRLQKLLLRADVYPAAFQILVNWKSQYNIPVMLWVDMQPVLSNKRGFKYSRYRLSQQWQWS